MSPSEQRVVLDIAAQMHGFITLSLCLNGVAPARQEKTTSVTVADLKTWAARLEQLAAQTFSDEYGDTGIIQPPKA